MWTSMSWQPFLTFLASQNLSAVFEQCLALKSGRRVNDSPLMDLMLDRGRPLGFRFDSTVHPRQQSHL